jgi:D-alanine-D-alanine ligase
MIDDRVVLIADRVGSYDDGITLERLDLEFTEDAYFEELMGALQRVCREVVWYGDPETLVSRLDEHRNDLVFSLWSGVLSRNRRALVPSICETAGIRYFGADSYASIVCQDKTLSKAFCLEVGIDVPKGQLLMSEADFPLLDLLRPPLVIKPNFEGGSIGISEENLVTDREAARQLCRRLFRTFDAGLLAEEFVAGREICVVMSGSGQRIDLMEGTEVVMEGATFDDRIWGYELKKEGRIPSTYRNVTAELSNELRQASARLWRRLSKVDLMRIDGKLHDGRFTMIELSPDAYIGPSGAVFAAYAQAGYSYDAMVEHLLVNAGARVTPGSASTTKTQGHTGSTPASDAAR